MANVISKKISPMIWMDKGAEEAASLYASVFPNSKTGHVTHYSKEGFEIHGGKEGTVMTIEVEIDGYPLMILNGGPLFTINPSISFFVTYESADQIQAIWDKLSENGKVLMALDKYPWSEKYGWLQDQYGVTWQLSLGDKKETGGDSIVPFLMFVKEHTGQAEHAMDFYVSVFHHSSITGALRYGPNELPDREGTIKHAQFKLEDQTFMAMDSAHAHQFTFNEAISLMIHCDTQDEIDYYWDKLTSGGDPKAQVCGWLKDKFGVSWQVSPRILGKLLQDPDKARVERVTKAFMKMKKFNIEELKQAYEGTLQVT
jgi:predicted 3-demethylubiquinone-9 3-methyltransferase (glyoxalase superfamily)